MFVSTLLVTLFLFEKTFIFFLLLLRYSVFKDHLSNIL